MKHYIISLLFILCSTFSYANESKFLPVEKAFPFMWEVQDQGAILTFDTQQGYYLYKSRFSFKSDEPLTLSAPIYSQSGEKKQDPNFGQVIVFHDPLTITLPYTGQGNLTLRFQGCADDGLCYLPQNQVLDLPLKTATQPEPDNNTTLDFEQLSTDTSSLSSFLSSAGKPQALLVFFLLGLGLSLTPCVLPMIPILASIIGGQKKMSGKKGAALSSAYVLGMASSYAITGILVTTLAKGINLQSAMQQPWLLSVFAAIFILLALAMFGFYELQLPSSLQQKLNQGSDKLGGGKLASVFMMGAISALVVSPCVSAPLAGALLYVSTTQDWLFGGTTLFVMAIGMGVPLIVIGASGGRLLLRSGPWMVSVKQVFGVLLLSVSVVLLSRFIEPIYVMGLWAALAVGSGIHFGALEPSLPGWPRTRRLFAFVTLFYGLILIIGLLLGNTDPLNPLKSNQPKTGAQQNSQALSGSVSTQFTKLSSISLLEQQIQLAANNGDKLLIDLYADWCVSCKVIEKNVFNDVQVNQSLADWKKIKLDITDSTPEQMAWLSEKNVFGPPAIFFYRPGGEVRSARVMGDIDKNGFNMKLIQANRAVSN